MAAYVAVIEGPQGTREIAIQAAGHRAALAIAKDACRGDEFVRGVREA